MSSLDLQALKTVGTELRRRGQQKHEQDIQQATALIEYSLSQEPLNKSSMALAADILLKILNQSPQNSEAHALMGYILFLAEEIDQAYFHIQKSLTANADNLFSQLMLSQIESYKSIKRLAENQNAGQLDEALEHIQQSINQAIFVYSQRLAQLPLQLSRLKDLEHLIAEVERVKERYTQQVKQLEQEHNTFMLYEQLDNLGALLHPFKTQMTGLHTMNALSIDLAQLSQRLEALESQFQSRARNQIENDLELLLDDLDLIADRLDPYAELNYAQEVLRDYEDLIAKFETFQDKLEI